MSYSRQEVQVEWGGGTPVDTQSIALNSEQTSNDVACAVNAVARNVQCKSDNAGTPATLFTVDVYCLSTSGDPDVDPDSADEYDSVNNGIYLGTLNHETDDPAIGTFKMPLGMKSCKIHAKNRDGTNAVTFSAQMEEILWTDPS